MAEVLLEEGALKMNLNKEEKISELKTPKHFKMNSWKVLQMEGTLVIRDC